MQQTKYQQSCYTPEEYLALEDKAKDKSEYFDGEIFTMAGASLNHNRVINNIYFILRIEFKASPHSTRQFFNQLN